MKLLYKPFGIATKVFRKRLSQSASEAVWIQAGHPEGAPSAAAPDRTLVSVVVTAALDAAVPAVVGAVVDQLSARAFHSLFGAWPPAKPAKKKGAAATVDGDASADLAA
jgi:uncharacterized protein DUF4235